MLDPSNVLVQFMADLGMSSDHLPEARKVTAWFMQMLNSKSVTTTHRNLAEQLQAEAAQSSQTQKKPGEPSGGKQEPDVGQASVRRPGDAEPESEVDLSMSEDEVETEKANNSTRTTKKATRSVAEQVRKTRQQRKAKTTIAKPGK